MSSFRLRPLLQTSALWLAMAAVALAQTPQQSSPQIDATRPPGAQQRQGLPPEVRPAQTDPTAPPGSPRTSPQSPPGSPQTTPQTTPPSTPVAPVGVSPQGGQTSPATDPTGQTERSLEPLLDAKPRPLPPLPSRARVGVAGDEQVQLSLNDAIRRALENNNEIEFARGDVRLAETQLQALLGAYDPVFQFSPTLFNTIEPQASTLGGANQSGTTSLTTFDFNPSVNKRFGTGGGNYQFFFNNQRRTNTSQFNTINPVYASSLGVTFTQPLLRDRSIDRTRRDIRVQRKRLEQSDAEFRRRTIDVISQVQRAYWDLVFAIRDEQNQLANLNLARENFRRTEASVAAGASAPLERAEVQTELSNRESALLIATQNVTVAENNLKSLILRDPLSKEWSTAIAPVDQPSFDANPVNLTDALNEARANRPELRRLRLQQDISDVDVKFFRNQTKPRVDVQATFASTGLAGSPTIDPLTGRTRTDVPENLIGGYGKNLGNLFGLDTRNVSVGVTIQIPLRNRTAQAQLAGARIEREQLAATTRSQEQVVEVEVRNAVQAVETARQRVLAARAARENAELQLTGEQRLFRAGRSTTFLLFQRENQLVNARNQELRAETDYNKARAELQRSTSTTLRANNVIVENPLPQ